MHPFAYHNGFAGGALPAYVACSFYDLGAFDPQLTNAGLIIVDNVVMFTSAKGLARLSPINNIAQYYM